LEEESLIDFIANFKRLEGDAGTDNGRKVFAPGLHGNDGLPHYILHRTFPSCVYGCDTTTMAIVKQNRDTICCLDRNTKPRNISKDSIGVIWASSFGNILNMVGMGLTRQGQWSAGSIGTGLI
jgi:hypothetical protein